MAVPNLDELLARLNAQNLQGAPEEDVADQIELLSKEDLDATKRAKEDGNILQLVNNFYSEARMARASDEQQWLKNLDMYQGRQFTVWDDMQKRMVERPKPDYDHRFHVNIIEPIIRTEIAKTASVHPRATVMPASNEQQDIQAAIAAEQVWDWYYETSTYHTQTFSFANFWRAMCGIGFSKAYYDPSAIDEHATQTVERQFNEQMEMMRAGGVDISAMKPQPVRGRVTTKAVSPFHLLVGDLVEPDLQEQPWVMHAYVIPEHRARAMYGKHVGKDWRPTFVDESEIVSLQHLGIKSGGNKGLNHVLVLEFYIKENIHPLFPNGGMAIVAGNTLVGVSRNGLPYDHGEYPFAMLTTIETGRFYRKSTIESVTPMQDELNRVYNQITKQRDLLAKPMFYYDEGSFDPRRVRSKPGTHIPIRLGMRYPQPVPIQEVPQYVFNFVDRVRQHLDDVSGQHQVSRATSPGADTAASALALLKETDDDFLSPTFDSIQHYTRTMARQFLGLAVQYWEEPRMVKITGLDHAVDVRALRGADIATGTDIRIDGESVLPKSKAARAAQITEWIDKGIIPPEVGLEAMEMGTLGQVYNRLKVDRDAARRENTMIGKLTVEQVQQARQQQQAQWQEAVDAGQIDPTVQPFEPQPIMPINWYDNDAIHVEEHRAFANSQTYQTLPPEVQQVLEAHNMMHEQRLAEKLMQQEQLAGGENAGYDEAEAGMEPAVA